MMPSKRDLPSHFAKNDNAKAKASQRLPILLNLHQVSQVKQRHNLCITGYKEKVVKSHCENKIKDEKLCRNSSN